MPCEQCGRARDPQRSCSAEQVVEATQVPRRYAHTVLQALVRAGFVRSQSGPGGGYALVRAPEDIVDPGRGQCC